MTELRILKLEKEMKKSQRKKAINKVIIFFLILSLISCEKNSEKENIFYYKVKYDSEVLGYKARKYEFSNDTIFEQEAYYNSSGKISLTKKIFLKKTQNLFLVESDKKLEKKVIPFLTTVIDSCNHIENSFSNYEICYVGKTDYLSFKNVYKYQYNQDFIDGLTLNVYLDNRFIILGVDSVEGLSELQIRSKDVPNKILKKLGGVTEGND